MNLLAEQLRAPALRLVRAEVLQLFEFQPRVPLQLAVSYDPSSFCCYPFLVLFKDQVWLRLLRPKTREKISVEICWKIGKIEFSNGKTKIFPKNFVMNLLLFFLNVGKVSL